jgi:small subunit ribosomal protein S16
LAVKIRLRRVGAKKRPFYRLVVADARSPRDGRFIESVGTYDPLASPALVKIDVDKVREWMTKGARPTDIARALLVAEGVLERTGPAYQAKEKQPQMSKKARAKAEAAAGAPLAEAAAAEPASEPVAETAAEVTAETPTAEATETPAAEATADTAPEAPAESTAEAATDTPAAAEEG